MHYDGDLPHVFRFQLCSGARSGAAVGGIASCRIRIWDYKLFAARRTISAASVYGITKLLLQLRTPVGFQFDVSQIISGLCCLLCVYVYVMF